MWCCKCSNITIASVKRKRISFFFFKCRFFIEKRWFLYSMAIILCNMYSYRPTDNCKVGRVCLISENKKALMGQRDKGASHLKCTAVVAWQLLINTVCVTITMDQHTREEVGGAKAITNYVKPILSFFRIKVPRIRQCFCVIVLSEKLFRLSNSNQWGRSLSKV